MGFSIPATKMMIFKLPVDLDQDLEQLSQALLRTKADLLREALAELIWKYAQRLPQPPPTPLDNPKDC